ncbi:MAG: hypothetical protein GC178_00800 [Flavobacteriales bacterium]|nr:hypothetical protein [Flavobacteriales bacterium]
MFTELWETYSYLLPYLAIPVVSGLVGWGTNALAIYMTFYPMEFVGIKPFLGWQGIVPAKAAKMAEKSVDLMTTKLIDVQELFNKIEPNRIAENLMPVMERVSVQMIDEVMKKEAWVMWTTTPPLVKETIYRRAVDGMPLVAEKMMLEIRDNIEDFLDLKGLVVEHMTANKQLTNEIFLRCGSEEFKFIKISGLYFGFLFGIAQAIVWYFNDSWWLLPLGGLIVGWATNWLALKMIFNPKQEVRILGITFHGLFIKRQNEVATEYSKIVSDKILTVERMFDRIFRGRASDELVTMMHGHIKQAIDEQAGLSKNIYQLFAGTKKYDELKNMAATRFVESLPLSIHRTFEYTENALDLETTMREKMAGLSPDEFEGVLRPAFQEDEWILILVGAVLGALAGFAQLVFLFSDGSIPF